MDGDANMDDYQVFTVIDGYRDYQWLWSLIDGYQWLWMVMDGY